MSAGQSFSSLRLLKILLCGCCLAVTVSCTIVKNYPANKPFVYKTNINLIGNFSRDQKTSLAEGLKDQLDDSMRARRLDKLLWRVLKKPPVYDSVNADKSVVFMRALLISLGYFEDSISYRDTLVKVGRDQVRATIDFYVKPGKQWKLDTVVYRIQHPELQQLADSTRKQAFIKKGDAFAKVPISAELDRLTELYRNNGYLRFTRDELIGVWDTLDAALLQPSLDPFEQLELLERLRQRRKNPSANLELRLRYPDTAKLVKYYNGHVTIYPDYTIDTIGLTKRIDTVKGITIIQYRNKFKPQIFPPNIYLPRDSVYRQRRYIRTINRFNSLGTWRLVSIDQVRRRDSDTVDFIIRLTPAKKYSFTTNVEGSFNQSAYSGNLFGVGLNVGIQNKNLWKAANLATTNMRYGVEFGNSAGSQFIQTQQASFSHTIYFPRAILFNRYIPDNRKDNWRTTFNFSAANTERRLLYNLTTVNGAWGYEFQQRNKLITVKIPNVEYSYLKKRQGLIDLINNNPSLRNIFTDGFIISGIGNLTLTGGRNNHLNVLRSNLEVAGLLAGLIKNVPFLDTNLYRFAKFDVELARLIKRPKSSIALRFFAGVGYEFGSTVNPLKKNNLPFFKQYFSGGPNSMRAWGLRRLGPGSTIKDFKTIPDRYGDVQLEFNAEFRFPIFKPLGIPINGALFTDMGNVWFLKKQAGLTDEVFNFGRLGQDIAIGAGAGLRVDFSFFVIRFDYSYKVKDPSPSLADAAVQNKWFGYPFFKGDQFQLGIGYPFIF